MNLHNINMTMLIMLTIPTLPPLKLQLSLHSASICILYHCFCTSWTVVNILHIRVNLVTCSSLNTCYTCLRIMSIQKIR